DKVRPSSVSIQEALARLAFRDWTRANRLPVDAAVGCNMCDVLSAPNNRHGNPFSMSKACDWGRSRLRDSVLARACSTALRLRREYIYQHISIRRRLKIRKHDGPIRI